MRALICRQPLRTAVVVWKVRTSVVTLTYSSAGGGAEAVLRAGYYAVAKMRVFRYPIFVGSAFAAAALAVFLLFVSQGF
jgi:hypothetical protein